MTPLLVEVRRGGTAESRHRVHAVAVRDGEIVAACGDPDLVCFLRSAAKPLQALVLASARPDLDDCDLAIASSSHAATPAQLAAVETLLRKAGATPGELECTAGPDGLAHMCSGKHAGMLAACVARGWPTDGYREPGHPLQQAVRRTVATATGLDEDELLVAVDGCGVPTFGVELWRLARAYASLADTPHGARVVAAIRAHPELLAAPRDPGLAMMSALDGWIAKTGVEGVLAAAGPDGTAIALKVEDGNPRALDPALRTFLQRLGFALDLDAELQIRNSHGAVVGELAAA